MDALHPNGRPEHLIPREANHADTALGRALGFNVQAPQHKLNLGELHNLSIVRGTLTREERYLVNDHIVQTILMLEKLPLPAHLRRVPEIAGGHHEKMDGTGYPKGLGRDQLSVEARIMAVADIFEALTASDRPYKTGKKLSEVLAIMRQMASGGHIDPDVFELLLRSGLCTRYAREFLRPDQLDLTEDALQHYASTEAPAPA